MSGGSAWIRTLAGVAPVSGEDLLRLWAEEDRETEARADHPQAQPWQKAGTDAVPVLHLTDADIDRVAQALCRRLLDAAGNM